MFKPFYIHYNRPSSFRHMSSSMRHAPRGFTAYFAPDPNNPRMCFAQITFCSNKDQFVKREGRRIVQTKPVDHINKRDIPGYLNDAYTLVWQCPSRFDQYFYVLKYVV